MVRTLRLPTIRQIAFALGICILILTLWQTASIISQFHIDGDPLRRFRRLIDFESKMNISTWFLSMLLFFAAVPLALIAAAKSRDDYKLHWAVLSGIFVILAIDESSQMFERKLFYLTMVIIIGVTYLRFVLALPSKTRLWVILSAGVYITGAMGLDGAGVFVGQIHGRFSFEYHVMVTLEEMTEMIGVSMFILTITDYLKTHHQPRLMLHVDDESSDESHKATAESTSFS